MNKLEIIAAAKAGDAKAQHTLGGMYLQGIGVRQDMVEAVKWYRLAATQGIPLAAMRLEEILTDD